MKTPARRSIAILLVFAFSLLLLSCAGVETQQRMGSVDIAPPSGLAPSDVKITGKGFLPDEEVDILFVLEETAKVGLGTAKVDVIKADATGNFSVPATIPMNAKPGKYKVEIIGGKGTQAATMFEVTPKK